MRTMPYLDLRLLDKVQRRHPPLDLDVPRDLNSFRHQPSLFRESVPPGHERRHERASLIIVGNQSRLT